MISAFYSSKSGAKNYLYYLDAVSNNIANVNTNGYKTQNVSFSDLLYTDMKGPEGDILDLKAGSGSRVQITRDMSQGAIIVGANSDYIVDGAGYFAVGDSDNNIMYAKSAGFTVKDIDGRGYLMTSDGYFVLDANYNKITIEADTEVTLAAPGENRPDAVTIGVFDIGNQNDLIAKGGGKYILAEGAAAALDTESVVEGKLIEKSNVDMISEMSKLITAQRGFQINVQMIKTADEIEQYSNNLR